MGTVASYTRDLSLQKLAFNPPQCGYSLGQCEIVSTSDGNSMALRLFVPECDGISDTRQRWIARRDYVDLRLLCILSHGNSDDLDTSAAYSQWLADTFDMNVVSYDYMGYGMSTAGMTTERSMCAYIQSVYELAVNRMGVPPQKILLWGKSIGSGPSIYLASENCAMCGVVLVSPIASGMRCVLSTERMPRSIVSMIDEVFMPSVERITRVQVPTCVIHGTDDTVVSIDNAQALVAACGSKTAYPPLYVPAGHNDIETKHGMRMEAHVRTFLGYVSRIVAQPYLRDVNE